MLAHLGADLCREDPILAVALLRMCPPQPRPWVRITYDTVITLALIETLACLALVHNGTATACLAAAGLAAAARAVRVRRFPPRSRGPRTRPVAYL